RLSFNSLLEVLTVLDAAAVRGQEVDAAAQEPDAHAADGAAAGVPGGALVRAANGPEDDEGDAYGRKRQAAVDHEEAALRPPARGRAHAQPRSPRRHVDLGVVRQIVDRAVEREASRRHVERARGIAQPAMRGHVGDTGHAVDPNGHADANLALGGALD